MNKFKKCCIFLSIIILISMTLTNIYAINNYKKNTNKTTVKSENIIVKEEDKKEKSKKTKDVLNILLIGTDSNDFKKTARSDSMMILTIDKEHKDIKLTSLARDTLVNIPGYGFEKLTHAYAYGKADLLLETIQKNFYIDIDDYITVNFNSFIDLVDILGGVEVDIQEKEISHLNDIIVNSFKVSNKEAEEPQFIRSSGRQLLNGYQALSYARIRQIDSIYERDKRQRDVLKSIANKLIELPVSSYPTVIKELLPYVDINISITKLISLANILRNIYDYDIKQMEFPVKNYRESGKLSKNNSFVVKWDKTENLKILKDFMYSN